MKPNNIQTAEDAYTYARDVIKGKWKEGEKIIATDSYYAYMYARYIIKDRFPEGEPIIASDTCFAFWYAYKIIKGRWLEAEVVIMFSNHLVEYVELCVMNPYEIQ